jgi:hypothetical protein
MVKTEQARTLLIPTGHPIGQIRATIFKGLRISNTFKIESSKTILHILILVPQKIGLLTIQCTPLSTLTTTIIFIFIETPQI